MTQAPHPREARAPADLVCFSHLRWNFVFQRPQHLMSRFARERRVFFFEEPERGALAPRLVLSRSPEGVLVATPHLPSGLDPHAEHEALRELLDALLVEHGSGDRVLWYYTPMALPFSRHLAARAVVYDCMDELALFRGAPPVLVEREAQLLRRADVVFTGGVSLWEAKRGRHPSVHAFPSSVDVAHFARARAAQPEPAELAGVPRPRIGFCGVVDERLDAPLVEAVARARPAWRLVMVGPVVKIDPASLPRLPNLHWVGGRDYGDLPRWFSAWDVAMMPFARNEATRFISPTKTPEYLAAGLPVVSTSIRDVVRPYGERGLVRIADDPDAFVRAIEACLAEDAAPRRAAADAFLATRSWDDTWRRMRDLTERAAAREAAPRATTHATAAP
jgi:UDP-galactopyranose mutase